MASASPGSTRTVHSTAPFTARMLCHPRLSFQQSLSRLTVRSLWAACFPPTAAGRTSSEWKRGPREQPGSLPFDLGGRHGKGPVEPGGHPHPHLRHTGIQRFDELDGHRHSQCDELLAKRDRLRRGYFASLLPRRSNGSLTLEIDELGVTPSHHGRGQQNDACVFHRFNLLIAVALPSSSASRL